MPSVHAFLKHVDCTIDGCWTWLASTNKGSNGKGGYGQYQKTSAHRYAYSWWIGPIPDGMFVCHTCDNRLCVRPSHLFLGNNSDNMQDMWRKGRAGGYPMKGRAMTQCKRGHPLDGVTPPGGRGKRFCKTCRSIAEERYRRRKGRSPRHYNEIGGRCKRGHSLTGENVVRHGDAQHIVCVECVRLSRARCRERDSIVAQHVSDT